MSTSGSFCSSFIWQIGGDASLTGLLEPAAREVCPQSEVRRSGDLAEAVASAHEMPAALVLCDPPADLVARARGAVDAAGLPRWAVVVAGRAPPGMVAADTLPRSDWSVAALARALRGAWTELQLRRENARLRGDLATFGHRIAHDLRTPLGGVLTTTEMLREILSEDCPKNVALTQPILDSTDGLVKLIERVSLFAKALGSNEPPQRFSMSQPFWNAFQQLESHLLQKGASLQQPADWPMVQGHATWLQAVWRHLIENAVQHGGRRIEAGWTPDTAGVRFWLRDDGQVAAERQTQLFFPFHRLHEPGAPRGLGLPMARALIERDGGQCGFAARAGDGSEFYFVLPA